MGLGEGKLGEGRSRESPVLESKARSASDLYGGGDVELML